jgi:hypothetical protein
MYPQTPNVLEIPSPALWPVVNNGNSGDGSILMEDSGFVLLESGGFIAME